MTIEIRIPARWPRVRDLPERERVPFMAWLAGQTRPLLDGVPDDDQDGYYRSDYERWRAGWWIWD